MSETFEKTNDEYGSFPPKTIVLAKLKSFPPWPGIVIPNELIPEGIFRSRPKAKPATQKKSASRGGRRGRRGRGGRGHTLSPGSESLGDNSVETNDDDNRLWCVRFLRDDTFMWATNKDISLLSEEKIKAFLEKNQKAKKTIRLAYEMALNPPDLEEFIIYGSDGKPMQVDNEADDEDFKDEDAEEEEEEDEDGEGDLDDEEDQEDEEEEEEEELKPKRRKRKQATKTSETPIKKRRGRPASSRKKAKKSVSEMEPETSGDEDWENDIGEDQIEPVAVDIPTSKDLQSEIKSFTPLIKKFKSQLLLIFTPIDKESKEDFEINPKDIKALKNIFVQIYNDDESPPVALVKHFGLQKVLFNILKQPILLERKDLINFRELLTSFVEELFGVVIEVEENWSYKEEAGEKEENESGDIKNEENGSDDINNEENGENMIEGEEKETEESKIEQKKSDHDQSKE